MNENERRRTMTVTTAPEADENNSNANGDNGFAPHIGDAIARGIWEGIKAGDFRLAIKCRRCGRYLVDSASKRRHLGPTCAVKVAAEAVTR